MPESPRIIVIGATGFTGRLVARELRARRAAGAGDPAPPTPGPAARAPTGPASRPVPVVLTGRDPSRLDRLAAEAAIPGAETALVDVRDPASLARTIRAGDVVISCAGPFAELGEPVVARCVEAGASYVDTTGEQPWMREMRERYHEPARAAGVAIVNGMAFEWALGDCAAALLARRGRIRALDVIYAWGGTASSRGTRRTSLRIIGARAWELEAGRWRRRPAASARRTFIFAGGRARWAVAFGAGEVVTVPRWSDAATVRGWLVMGRRNALAARALSPALPWVVPLLRPVLERIATRAEDPTDSDRAESVFTIRLEAELEDGSRVASEVAGADPYGLTATIAVAGAERALGPDRASGVIAPSQLVDPGRLLDDLAPRVRLVPER